MGKLNNKVAVITGAASGIGRATAALFAGEGAAVVIGDLNVEGGEAAMRDCKENGGRAVFQKTDVVDENEVKAMVERAVNEFGGLDIIYNNAGLGGALGPLEEITVENWDRSLAVLLRGVFLGMKHAIPEMRKRGGGSIISTASIAGLRGYPGLHAYCAAKAAVVNLTRSAAIELGKDRIRVNCICPGGINTPIFTRTQPSLIPLIEERLAQAQPIPRAGHPEDIAKMALFLASNDSEWLSGQAMVVDGAATAGGTASRQSPPEQQERVLPIPPKGFMGPSFQG
jgi:NAD(P)-dependent dehydrogenase (short-subunit alcohol dehydrogenase family)